MNTFVEPSIKNLKNMKIKGLLFDYGGTLDTAGCHWGKMLWHAYERQKVPVTEAQFREAYVYAERTLGKNPIIQPNYTFRKTLEVKVRIEFEDLASKGLVDPAESAIFQKAVVADLYDKVVRTTAESARILTALKENYRLALVSNFYGNINVVLEEFGLANLFSDVIESAVVGVRKPDPRIWQIGAERLALQPDEVAVVGDSVKKDIIPAKRIGCKAFWLRGEGWTDEPIDASPADVVIERLAELLEFLKD